LLPKRCRPRGVTCGSSNAKTAPFGRKVGRGIASTLRRVIEESMVLKIANYAEGHVGPALRQKRPLATDATVVATPAAD
jgi:hypothetical protein